MQKKYFQKKFSFKKYTGIIHLCRIALLFLIMITNILDGLFILRQLKHCFNSKKILIRFVIPNVGGH